MQNKSSIFTSKTLSGNEISTQNNINESPINQISVFLCFTNLKQLGMATSQRLIMPLIERPSIRQKNG